MKAAEPGSTPKAEKYGMPIEYAPRIIDRHFGVLDEEAALAGAQYLHQIQQSRVLRAAEDRARQLAAPVPPVPPALVSPSQPAIAEAADWRGRLGLS